MSNSLVKNTPPLVVVNNEEIGVWEKMRIEAQNAANEEPILATLLHATVLNHNNIARGLAYHLAQKLGGTDMNALQMREVCAEAYVNDPEIVKKAEDDMEAVLSRDPACQSYLQPFLYFKGFQALQSYRIAHYLWQNGRKLLALHLQSRVSELFQVDIHPAAKIGRGLFIDHATGVVVGETAVIGDNVSILHNVTLGGTGKEGGDRHPKIGNGVLIGAGAKVLGNICVGDNARIAAGSLVLKPVPPCTTVAGIPAKIVGSRMKDCCAQTMDHIFDCADVATFDPGL